jgi:PAS domain-containing protein
MSTESIDDRIARLEKELAEARAGRQRPEWERPNPKSTNKGDPFFVTSEDDLYLRGIPDFIYTILEALPVSVFLKFSEVKEGGRQFTYMNQKARSRLKWTAEEVSSHYDSEAFLDRWKNPLYKAMLDQETKTLGGDFSRYMPLEWQPPDQHGRRSQTLEVPIFKGDKVSGEPVGFCAIAEEVEAEVFPFIHSWLREVTSHEYGNMCKAVQRSLDGAVDLANKVKTQPPAVGDELSAT